MIKSGEVASPFRIASNAPGVSEKKKTTQNVEDARARYSNLRGPSPSVQLPSQRTFPGLCVLS